MISNTINSMITNISNAYDTAQTKGATIPQNKNLENLANTIDSIQAGGGGGYQRPSDWLTIPTLDTTKDEIYILNGVIDDGTNMIFFKISGTGAIDWGDGSTPETFTSANQATFSHHYNYADINSNTWTNHNMSRQVLVHISGSRGAITYFSLAVDYSYTNADGVTVDYDSYGDGCNGIYEVKADVNSANLFVSKGNGLCKKMEAFDWKGTIPFNNNNGDSTFVGCYSLQSIPNLDTSKFRKMNSAFNKCYSLEIAPEIDTSDVRNTMDNMFAYCYSLKSVPLYDTSQVQIMSSMFKECKSLKNIPKFDTNKVYLMDSMFYECRSLETVPKLNTKIVTNMNAMFYNCSTLRAIPELDTRVCNNMSGMFYYCYSLQDVPQLNTSNITEMGSMFSGCRSLEKIPELDASKVTSINNMFNQCYLLQSVKLYNLNPTYSSTMIVKLSDCTSLTKQALVDFFNSIATNVNSYSRTIQLGGTIQGYLANCYVKDSGSYYTTILPTSDTSIQSGKTYYTYDRNTDTYTQVTPDFTSDTMYYELVTATWNKYVICESTDTGAMLALDFARNIKGYTIS